MTLQGAVSFARTLHKTLNFSYIKRILEYYEEYELRDDGTQVEKKSELMCEYVDPLPALIAEIKKRRNIRVVIQEVNQTCGVLAVARVVKGGVLQVRLQRELTYCVKRFAILKELLHYYDASLASSNTSEDALYEAICASMKCRFGKPDVFSKIHPEELCYYAAIETVLYWGEQGGSREFLVGLHAKHMPEYFMACAFRTPLSIVQYFFEDDSRYAGLSNALNLSCAV